MVSKAVLFTILAVAVLFVVAIVLVIVFILPKLQHPLGSCHTNADCPAGQYCDSSLGGLSSSCKTAKGEGDACITGSCGAGLTCIKSGDGIYRCIVEPDQPNAGCTTDFPYACEKCGGVIDKGSKICWKYPCDDNGCGCTSINSCGGDCALLSTCINPV